MKKKERRCAKCHTSTDSQYCPTCWGKMKGICPGCNKEITNKAYFVGAHVKGTCHRPGPYTVPAPLCTQKLAKHVIKPATDQQLESMFGPLPTTYEELRAWWNLPRLVYPEWPGATILGSTNTGSKVTAKLSAHDSAACGCVYIGLKEFSCGFKVAA